MHRDLKPSNILLDEKHLARIGNFGSRRLVEIGLAHTNDFGTPLHMAPEMAEQEYRNKVDVFSFVMILYEIVLGKKPLPDAMFPWQIVRGIQRGKYGEIPDPVLPFTKSLIERFW
jgi:serine/threonine protein kinase